MEVSLSTIETRVIIWWDRPEPLWRICVFIRNYPNRPSDKDCIEVIARITEDTNENVSLAWKHCYSH